MQAFENDLTDMVKNIKFTNHRDNFQKKIINDTKKIHNSNKISIFMDKTTNLYSTSFANYKKLTINNVTQMYKKAPEIIMNNINKEAKEIATISNIDHKMNSIAEQPAFITIKNHKPKFTTNPTYRLINPSKSEIGKISKLTLDNINTQLTNKLQLNQWKNIKTVTNWFTAIPYKNNTAFIQFDITDFYPPPHHRTHT